MGQCGEGVPRGRGGGWGLEGAGGREKGFMALRLGTDGVGRGEGEMARGGGGGVEHILRSQLLHEGVTRGGRVAGREKRGRGG